MVLAMLIAAVGIYFDQPILIVGAMVVGPEFGPIAGACVAIVNREPELARRSLRGAGGRLPARHRSSPSWRRWLLEGGRPDPDRRSTSTRTR